MYKVGDKVCIERTTTIGTIVKITEKRGDIVVDFGSYKDTYRKDGWTRGDIWSARHIIPLTDELQKQIDEKKLIRKCRDAFEKASLDAEKAEKILAILGD